MDNPKHSENVTRQKENLLLYAKIHRLSEKKQRLQPLFHPVIIKALERKLEALNEKEALDGQTPTTSITKLVEEVIGKWIISQNPHLIAQLLEQALSEEHQSL